MKLNEPIPTEKTDAGLIKPNRRDVISAACVTLVIAFLLAALINNLTSPHPAAAGQPMIYTSDCYSTVIEAGQ